MFDFLVFFAQQQQQQVEKPMTVEEMIDVAVKLGLPTFMLLLLIRYGIQGAQWVATNVILPVRDGVLKHLNSVESAMNRQGESMEKQGDAIDKLSDTLSVMNVDSNRRLDEISSKITVCHRLHENLPGRA